MTISTTASRASYNGNGVTTAFAFPNLFFSNTDLIVILVNASGVSVTQVLNTDYTVTGAGLDAGGTVTMTVAPGVGERLVIVRQVPLVQETDYTAGDSFPAESHERALDYLTMQTQQLQEALTRTLQLPIASDADASSINVEAVEIVAGIADDVTAVADVAADIALAADNIVAIQGAAGNAAAAAASAVAADASADAAAASAASISLPLAVAQGGTGATDAAGARANLGAAIASAGVPAGAVMSFATNSPPTGWLKANGATVSSTTYAALFAAIGSTFNVGGEPVGQFRLPDLRGEFVRGWDDGRGVDASRVFGSGQTDEFRSHTHTFTNQQNNGSGASAGSGFAGAQFSGNTGAAGGAETRPRNIALLACIKI